MTDINQAWGEDLTHLLQALGTKYGQPDIGSTAVRLGDSVNDAANDLNSAFVAYQDACKAGPQPAMGTAYQANVASKVGSVSVRAAAFATACKKALDNLEGSGISQEDYDALVDARDTALGRVSTLESILAEYEALGKTPTELQAALDNQCPDEHADYADQKSVADNCRDNHADYDDLAGRVCPAEHADYADQKSVADNCRDNHADYDDLAANQCPAEHSRFDEYKDKAEELDTWKSAADEAANAARDFTPTYPAPDLSGLEDLTA